MVDKEPIPYEKWDLTSPDLPPRSRLYALEPIGVGTPWVESLTGYIVRLAEAHCVTPGVLFRKEIDVLTGKGDIFNYWLEKDVGYSIHTINGLGAPAKDFVRALESLTYQHGLRYLSLLPWEEVLPRWCGFQRRARAWCSQCLRMWQAKGKPVYEPLLWTLKPVELCPIHHQALSFVCPSCKFQNGVLDTRARPGHCSRCRQWLAPIPTTDALPDSQAALTSDDLGWGYWVATVLGEMLAAAPHLSFVPRREGIAQTIRSCVEHIADGSATEFAREMEVGRSHVRRWRTGKTLPKFASLLGLSFRLGRSLLDLIEGVPNSVALKFVRPFPSQLSKKQFTSKKPRRPSGRRLTPADVSHIRQTLQTAMSEDPPPSGRQVIKRMDHCQTTVYHYFPEECHAITRRFADYRRIQSVARRDRARAEIREAVYQLHAKGTKITHEHLRPLLTSSYYIKLEEGRATIRQMTEELAATC